MFCNEGLCNPNGSQLTVLFLPPRNSSQYIFHEKETCLRAHGRLRPTVWTVDEVLWTGGAWNETQCPSPPSSEAARRSRCGAGAQSQGWCICLHTAPPATAQGCDLGRKTCSGLTWDMLGVGTIFREEHIKGGSQSAVLSRLLTWPIRGIFHM